VTREELDSISAFLCNLFLSLPRSLFSLLLILLVSLSSSTALHGLMPFNRLVDASLVVRGSKSPASTVVAVRRCRLRGRLEADIMVKVGGRTARVGRLNRKGVWKHEQTSRALRKGQRWGNCFIPSVIAGLRTENLLPATPIPLD
jgi:hypothetical protein